MIFFRVTENINIKITDGSLLKFNKLKKPSELINDGIYISTYSDVADIKKVFARVDSEKYQVKYIDESRIKAKEEFPKELGITNIYEHKLLENYNNFLEKKDIINPKIKDDLKTLALNERKEIIYTQLDFSKDRAKVAIVGGVGKDIGEIIASSTAIRILKENLKRKFKEVVIDVYIEATSNGFFERDKDLLINQDSIDNVYTLPLSVKKISDYDYYVDTSSVRDRSFYQELAYVDAYLYKFGFDYEAISSDLKYNSFNLSKYKPSSELKTKIEELKAKGDLVLYHPYSADAKRSIPEDVAKEHVRKLIKKSKNSIIISVLKIDKIKDDRFENLMGFSKSVMDFIYIVSQMDKVITVDTSTYHISDIFFIPTVVFFTNIQPQKRVKYYQNTKVIKIKDKSKNLSLFDFDNEELKLYKFDNFKSVKFSQVIKLLGKI